MSIDISGHNPFRSTIRIIIGFLFLVAFCMLFLLLDILPHRPNSLAGWLILVIVGIPSWVIIEWLGGIVLSKKLGYRISDKPFSGARIIYALVVFLVFLGIMFLLWKILDPLVGPYFSYTNHSSGWLTATADFRCKAFRILPS